LGALTVRRHCQSTPPQIVGTLGLLWVEVKAYEYLMLYVQSLLQGGKRRYMPFR
jgi:hypothetical protein